MITVDVKTDIAEALKRLYKLEPRQMPFIVSLAMNRTMKQIRIDEQAEMRRTFDSPTNYTLNSLRTIPATKERLESVLTFKDIAGRGVSAGKYLNEEIYGGQRRDKKFERALIAIGMLPSGLFAVPTSKAPLDANGNLPGAWVRQVLRVLQGNRRGGKNPDAQFMAVSDAGRLPLGIYQRNGRTLTRVVSFVKVKAYSKRYDFYGVAERKAKAMFTDELKKAANYAISTSKANITSGDIAAAIGSLV